MLSDEKIETRVNETLFASAAILTLSAAVRWPPSRPRWAIGWSRTAMRHIRIDNCGGKLWGIVVWEKEPGIDNENPDPAKKGRPLSACPS